MNQSMQDRMNSLIAKNEVQREKLRSQAKEIRRLRRMVLASAASDSEAGNSSEEEKITKIEEDVPGINDCEDTTDSDDELEEQAPLWDSDDNVHRCIYCTGEVVDSMCQFCTTPYDHYDSDEAEVDGDNPLRSVSTDYELLRTARQIAPRGSTPLREVDPSQLSQVNVAHGYIGREDEYRELLARGATRLMCEDFHLEFAPETGIVAWADPAIYEEFAGPAMKDRDHWKICLGREIQLDNNDLDGSTFMEDLLEEAVVFPNFPHPLWETVEESPGIWVTRPKALSPPIAQSDGSCSESEDEYDSGDEENYRSQFDKQWQYDVALERAGHKDPPSVIRPEDYETSDEDTTMDSDDTEESDDPGWTFHGRYPDDVYFDKMNTDDEEDEGRRDMVVQMGAEEHDITDSADSDFDDDEVLSGDEDTIRMGRRYFASQNRNL